MKKYIEKTISAILIAAIVFSFSSCGKELSVSEETDNLKTAVKNSLASDFYYYKETKNEDGNTNYRQVNVLTDIGKDYEPIKDESGNYSTLRIHINESVNGKASFEAVCGLSAGISPSDDSTDYLFLTKFDQNGNAVSKQKTKISAKEYFNSAEFSNYRLSPLLCELSVMTAENMDFNIKDGGVNKKGKVVDYKFKITDSYLEKFKAENGYDSMFAGTTSVTIETAYDKIAEVVTYVNENLDSKISVETERYKLLIVYLGPKFSIPKYNEKNADGTDIWQEK